MTVSIDDNMDCSMALMIKPINALIASIEMLAEKCYTSTSGSSASS